MDVPPGLLDALAPWQSIYSSSKLVATTVNFTHLFSLVVGGGLAIAADRRVLGTPSRDPEARAMLADVNRTHGPVVIALSASMASGIALTLADLQTYLSSWAFLVKLGLVALLFGNGLLLYLTERKLRRLWPQTVPTIRLPTSSTGRLWTRLRFSARTSLVLWTATLLAGTVLVNGI